MTTPDSRTMRERMEAGDLYIADDPEIEELAFRSFELVETLNAMPERQTEERRAILQQLFASFGEESLIRSPLRVDCGWNVTFGARSFAHFGLVALDVAKITIGNDVLIGPNVQLYTPTHPLEPQSRRDKWEAALPINIEDNVWLGGSAVVLPGVTIGESSVVGAGAVVTKDVPANCVVVGNPARVVRRLDV